jgi:hypothetical protein
MGPLNQDLYEALRAEFRRVAIANEGEEQVVEYRPNWSARGGQVRASIRAEPLISGEYYRVNCPFCTDTRQRLWINYRWAEYDQQTGQDNLHLATCFNEGCLDSQARRERLRDMVYPVLGLYRRRAPAYRMAGPAAADGPGAAGPEIRLPEGLVPVHGLSPDHPAARYLLGRGFDIEELWARWQVAYCAAASGSRPPIYRRLVVPIYNTRVRFVPDVGPDPAVLVGWQARAIGPVFPGEAKYLGASGMKKSRILYGQPAALASAGPVVVTEGTTDVWRLGTNAVALLGKTLSEFQRDQLRSRFRGRPLVLFFDRDAREEARAVSKWLQSARVAGGGDAQVVIANLPEGRQDVGECTRAEAWAAVADALGRPIEELGRREAPAAITAVPRPQT